MNIINCKNDLPAEFLENINEIAVDTEAMGLCPYRDRLCLAQFTKGDGNVYIVQFDNFKQADNIKFILNDNCLKIFHFARFDVMMLFRYLGVMTRNIFCTKIASKLARTYTDRHSLKSLCADLLNVELDKTETCTDWGNLELSDAQLKYAASDVIYLHQLKDKLSALLKRENITKVAQSCFNYLPTRIYFDLSVNQDYDVFKH